MDESEFHKMADETLEDLAEAIEMADEDGSVEVDLLGGILTITLDDERQYVINKHAPSLQIWVSSPESGASYYEYDALEEAWSCGGVTLHEMLSEELRELADLSING